MTPEFSRPERLDTIGEGERSITISAEAEERRKLAARFGIVAVDSLAATLTIRRDASGILATGRVTGQVVQSCSITSDPLTIAIDEPLALRFVEPVAGEEEVELSADALDTVEIEGSAIDLGEAAAETMALALDPFPRGPGAAEALKRAGVVGEDEAATVTGPFSALADLKKTLGG
jgi:uncharacterized metal-binding protein YceD (DUF177 family)